MLPCRDIRAIFVLLELKLMVDFLAILGGLVLAAVVLLFLLLALVWYLEFLDARQYYRPGNSRYRAGAGED